MTRVRSGASNEGLVPQRALQGKVNGEFRTAVAKLYLWVMQNAHRTVTRCFELELDPAQQMSAPPSALAADPEAAAAARKKLQTSLERKALEAFAQKTPGVRVTSRRLRLRREENTQQLGSMSVCAGRGGGSEEPQTSADSQPLRKVVGFSLALKTLETCLTSENLHFGDPSHGLLLQRNWR